MTTVGPEGRGADRAMVGAALLVVAHAVAVVVFAADARSVLAAHEVAGWAAALLGVVGTARAVQTFQPGDYLRRVWGLLAAGAALLVVGTALRTHWSVVGGGASFSESPLLPWRTAVILAANTVSTWALVLLALTYRRAGLTPPRSWQASAAWALGIVLAAGVALPQVRADVARLSQGWAEQLTGLTSLASTLADTTTIVLVVPLLRVAYLMRGGRLARVWWLVALSGAAWLVYDARAWLVAYFPGTPAEGLELFRVMRTVGLAAVGLAGLQQHAALSALAPRPAEAPAR